MRELLAWLTAALSAAFERRGTDWAAGELSRPDVEVLLAMLRDEYGPDHAGPADGPHHPALPRMREIFGLSELDADLLSVAAAADADPRVAALFGVLTGVRGPGYATASVALELAGRNVLDAQARGRLRPGSPLLRHRLLDIPDDGPFTTRRIRVPDRVVAHLFGDDEPESAIAAMSLQVAIVPSAVATGLGHGMRAGGSLVHLMQAPGTSGTATGRGAFDSIGIPSMVVDLSRRPPDMSAVAAAAEVTREAGLLGAGLVVTGVDDATAVMPQLLTVLTDSAVPVVVVDRMRWPAEWTSVVPLTAAAPILDRATRETLWRLDLAEAVSATPGWTDLLNLALTAEEIGVARQAADLRALAENRELQIADLRDAARVHGGAHLEASAQRIVPRATLADLILPVETRTSLDELVSWARHREELLGTAGLGGKGTKGSGILSLFAGSPGTGKTLAAEAVAGELGLELYTVELSSVVDKYIGETEKKLERIIREAESLNVVLFFDEADALFGSRSAVKEAKDRYANQEVSYLLQRMEQFDGLAVLATNLRGNLDPAFSRRLHFVVPFNDPPADVRAALWRSHLLAVPELDQADPVDIGRLAEGVEIAGGGIKNIVMAATFTATAARESVGMRHMLQAAHRELGKMGRRVPVNLQM
ncbi:AAA family ATPase [Nakamurella panacisegetis]|uniref:AAA family ATPase n=1 Tax=Nakamurella panacisegetis TaxID=1090615 RepID=UPI0012FD7A33|nr:AAA family ATPase [Nakamurella panacisegetis]